MKKIFGFILLSLPFIGILTYAAVKIGVLTALLAIGISLAIVACVFIGLYLIY